MFRSSIVNWLIVLSFGAAWAQNPPQPDKPEAAPEAKFAGRAEEVSLDLVVRDKRGRPVRDLKPEEIQILDDGHPAKVRSLRLAGSLGSSARTVDLPGQPTAAAAKPTPADPLKQVHLVSMLFETLDANGSKMARDGAYELLKGITSPNTYMAVLHVGARIGVAQSFTNEREPLKKAIDSLTNPSKLDARSEIASMEEQLRHQVSSQSQYDQVSRGDVSGLAGVGQSPGDPMALGMTMLLLDVMETSQRVTRDMHARPAMASLLGVIRTMAKLPGRKVIVYFSEGLPLSEGAADQFANLIGEANRAGVTIYTIDATGLDPDAKTHDNDPFISPSSSGLGQRSANSSNNMSTIKRQIGTNDRVADAMRSNSQSALIDMAISTGGSFMGNTNDIKKPMHKLVEDEETYYLAYYSPQIDGYDGHFRNITVKIDRPGVTVQTRSGYFALPPSVTPLRTFELPMLKALNDKTGQPDADLHAHAFEFSSLLDSVSGELAIEVPLSHMQIRENAGEKVFHLHFSILALVRDAGGNVVGQFSEDVPYQAASELKTTALLTAYSFDRSFTVHPGKYTLDVAVSDQNSDKVTITQSAFEFKGSTRPGLSEPLLVAKLDPQPSGGPPDAEDPLQYQGRKVVPSLTAQVRNDPGAALPVFFVMYPDKQATADGGKPSLALQVSKAGGALLANVPMPLPDSAGQAPTSFIATIPTQSLNPGDYVVRVVYAQGQAKVERDLPFVVQGEQRQPAAKPHASNAPKGDGSEPAELPEEASSNVLEMPDLSTAAQLVFSQSPAASARLSLDDQTRIIEGARERALRYTASLPNFTVRESTRRQISKSGLGNWNPRDVFTELVRFSGGVEERKLVEWNGQKSDLDRSSLDGMMLNGEFGFLLAAVFHQQAQAKFTWKESVVTGTERCEVFSFQVDRTHSMYKLRSKEGRSVMLAAYDGEVYLDSTTFHIRRVTLHTIDLPKEFPIRSTALRVDYDLWRSAQGDHLVPVNGVIQVQTRRTFERNEVQFTDYHRLGSESTVKFGVN
jgi:VWFA-related protein